MIDATVTVRFHRGRGILAWIVRLWTRCPWGHVDLLIPGLGVLDVRPAVGCRVADMSSVPYWGHTCAIDITVPRPADLLAYVTSRCGDRYDWGGAVAAGLPGSVGNARSRVYCAEAVAEALAAGGVALQNTSDLSPRDLFEALHHV